MNIKKMKNKKGQLTILMFILLVALLLGLVLLLVGGLVTVKINEALDKDIYLGKVNLKDYNAKTFGKFNEMYLVNADWWGIALIFGMVMGLFLSAYFTRNTLPKWGIVIDLFIIITVFFVALYLASSYQTLLNALADAGETFLEDYASKTSMFMLNLHIFVVIIGVVMMVLFHSSIPKRTEERIQNGGYLQGV